MKARDVYVSFLNFLYLMLPLLLLISLTSCSPRFKNPIPPPPELKADSQILGTWTRTFKVDQYEYKEQLSIFPRNSGWIDVVWIYDIDRGPSTDGINLLVLEGYSTSVNKQRFLCLRFRKKDFSWILRDKDYSRSDNEVGASNFVVNWIIVNYETLNNGELVIKPFSTQRVEELIKKGKLKGEVVKDDVFKGQIFEDALFNGQRFEDVLKEQGLSPNIITVTSSADELIDLISREDVGAFIGQDANDTFRYMNVLIFSKLGGN